MKCPHCKEETFKKKPHMEPNAKSVAKYHKAEHDQFMSHVKKHRVKR